MYSAIAPSGTCLDASRPAPRGWRRAALLAPGLFAVVLIVVVVPSLHSGVVDPARRVATGGAGLARLQLLPLQGQSVISAAVGSAAAPFAAERQPGGYGLAGGGVTAHLTARGVTTRVSSHTLSLTLSGVGRGARLVAPAGVSPTANANRVVYERAGVQEWYAAGPLGIEQGFSLAERPAGTTEPLTVALRVAGSLHAILVGSEVRFLDSSGAVRARYGGLTALDAGGRTLPATLAVEGGRLLLHISDRDARYPLHIDPLIQQGPKLTANDELGGGPDFGWSVALSADGNTALISGYGDNNGCSCANGTPGVGAAWVFTRSGATWTQQGGKLTANDEVGRGSFGDSVALSADGNTALIGGHYDNGGGAAWVFRRSGATWTQQGPKLSATDGAASGFGDRVALSADGNTALIDGYDDHNSVEAAWVFTRSGASWTQEGPILTANDDTGSAGWGSVALSADGNTALLSRVAINDLMGAVWVFTRSGTTWTQQGPKLIANDQVRGNESGWAGFGSSVALSADGNTALIGGWRDNNFVGAAWVFTRSGATWTQQSGKLTANDATGRGTFGESVALSADGNTALIGGSSDNSFAGAAWVFTRSGATWTQHGPKLSANDETNTRGYFGWSVALSQDASTALIGGPLDNSDTGAAWVFGPALVGNAQTQPNVDSNPAGTAEAFRYTAVGSGTTSQLSVYLDRTNTATTVLVGLYTNTSSGNPGTLLTGGAIRNPRAGAWNSVTVSAASVRAGTDYWLAVLAPLKAGTIKFRDLPDGTGDPTQTSAQTSLSSITGLPNSWKAGTHYANSPASLYAATQQP